MMEQCEFCHWLETKANMLYEDEYVGVAIDPKPSAIGHLIAFPREHHTIIEQLSPQTMQRLAVMANRFSVILFETLHAQGTNVLIQNGTAAGQHMPHVGVHIIPRYERDGIDLSWKSRPLSEEQMASVELAMRAQLEAGAEPPPKPAEPKPSAPKVNDLMLRQLDRIP